MTTIAYRDGVLASDTGICINGTMVGALRKISRVPSGDMAAACGDANYCAAFLKWFDAGERDDPPKSNKTDGSMDGRGIVFRRDGIIEVFEPPGRYTCRAAYFAIGSGMDYALGAMFVGAGASEAVRAAMAHDPHSGGNVNILSAK